MIFYLAVVSIGLGILVILYKNTRSKVLGASSIVPPKPTTDPPRRPPKASKPAQGKKKGKQFKPKSIPDPVHELFSNCLKGYQGVTSMDVRGNNLALTNAEGDIRVYAMNTLDDLDNPVRGKLEKDTPEAIGVSKLGDVVAIAGRYTQQVYLFTLDKGPVRKFNLSATFQKAHKQLINCIAVCSKFVVTSAEKNDTSIVIYSYSGEVLDTFDTRQNENYTFKVSADERFLSVAAWVADVKIFELKQNKQGEYSGREIAMDLKGHKRGLYDLSFNEMSNLILTSSKDGKIRIYNIDVRYKVKEDPKLLETYEAPEVDHCSIHSTNIALSQGDKISFHRPSGFAEFAPSVSLGSNIKSLKHLEAGLVSLTEDGRVLFWKTN